MGNTDKFLQHVRDHLGEYGFTLKRGRGELVNSGDGWRAAGYFCGDTKIIAYAGGGDDWLSTLTHEYAHFLQWLDSGAVECRRDGNASNAVEEFLYNSGKLTKAVREAFRRVIFFERDAEMRARNLIIAYNLPISIEKYVKKANCYLYSYHVTMEYGLWNFKKSPYSSSAVLKNMPSSFRSRPDLKCPKHIFDMLKKYY